MNRLGHPEILRPEKQMVAALPLGLAKAATGLGGEEPESLRSGVLEVGLPAGMLDEVDVLPVVHSRPLQMLVIDLKAEWVDQVQPRADRKAGAPDVSRVVGNQRGAEDDVQ